MVRVFVFKILIVFYILFSSFYLEANTLLSDKAEIRIITCGPSQEELYTAFGHSAIRVFDPENNIDILYNYGVFDFNQPNFYLNFTRGNLNYKLSSTEYKFFRDYYIRKNRFIHEQILNFSTKQKNDIYNFLIWNNKPTNQYYRYDYFYNNCATKVRDVILELFENEIIFDSTYVSNTLSIRNLTDIYLQEQKWGDLGIDICLGMPMDKIATPYMYMFLPDYVESAFNHAKIKTDSGTVSLVNKTIKTYEPKAQNNHDSSYYNPFNLFIIFFTLLILFTIIEYKWNYNFKIVDIVLFLITGFLGLFLLLLWFLTDHSAAKYNLNLLWALPTNIVLGFGLFFKRTLLVVKYYLFIIGVVYLLLTIFWPFLPQNLNSSLLPLILSLMLRSFVAYIRLFKRESVIQNK